MKIKTYNDSKEFPLQNYERCITVGDFFYMIKGYEAGDEVEADKEEMENKFNEVVQDYVVSLNAKNNEIVNYGKAHSLKMEILKYSIVKDLIQLQIKNNYLCGENRMEQVKEMMKGLKIQKTDDLEKQVEIIDRKIEKLKNDIELLESKKPEQKEDSDINEIITNVELVLERGINMREVSLYRFGIMQEQARKKIQQLNKQNNAR